jgi:hypothetical protein
MAGIKTSTIAMLAGGAVVLYLLTKPKVPAYSIPAGTLPPYYPGSTAAASAAQAAADAKTLQTGITAGGDVLNNLLDDIFG